MSFEFCDSYVQELSKRSDELAKKLDAMKAESQNGAQSMGEEENEELQIFTRYLRFAPPL